MRAWTVRILVAGVILCGFYGLAEALSFDTNPVVGDRRVSLTWTPQEDDPVFTGNLSLYFLRAMQVAEDSIPFLAFTRSGGALWLWEVSSRRFVQWHYDATDRTWQKAQELSPVAEGTEVLSCALHPDGVMLLAGLDDGTVMVWRPHLSSESQAYEVHASACRGLAFKPLASSTDSSFVSVGEDGYWRHWTRPGILQKEVLVAGSTTLTSLGIARDGVAIAVGKDDGKVAIYSLRAGTDPRAVTDGHDGRRIAGLSFSTAGDRLASADSEGGIRVWGAMQGELRGGCNLEQSGGVFIAYTPRESNYIIYARRDGTVGMCDGFTGRAYEMQGDLGRPITGCAISSDGFSAYFADDEGMIESWYMGNCVPCARTPECFGGYIIWRGDYPDPDSLKLLRIYDFGDTTWGWTSCDTARAFVDPDSIIPRGGGTITDPAVVSGPHNGMPFYYSLTRYSWKYLDGGVHRVLRDTKEEGFFRDSAALAGQGLEADPTPLIPRVAAIVAPPLLANVFVVPNPFIEGDPSCHFGPQSSSMVQFFNLPEEATLRIYTNSGDLIQVMHHFQTQGGMSGGSCSWDLKNDHGTDVTSGVYLFAVEAPGGESIQGFFTIIR
ncbi:MAG: hypothetical protein KAY24_12930 [Candidatus Eisenbacteria sp.]|nr:hypothetical protein [Candidatus Eisenbacteria bacterium]